MTGDLLTPGPPSADLPDRRPPFAAPPDRPWVSLATHRRWLESQVSALGDFARGSVRPAGGFWWLDAHGRPDADEPQHTWIACRMTHVFALATLRGEPGAGPIVDHGIAALAGPLRDQKHGGWYGSVAHDGSPLDTTKAAYPHAFVMLAAASATLAGRVGAAELLADTLDVVNTHFWDDDAGRLRESWTRDWAASEPYRGANSSMHMVEAFLAVGDATGDRSWSERALRVCAHLVHEVAAAHDWRMPEHFTPGWEPLPEYQAEHPADPFRPYGATVGHWLEWSRLLLHVESALADPPDWLLADARALFANAVRLGWEVDGAPGFIYTVGWDDRPVVRARMHWVMAEAIGAAATLGRRTGEVGFENWYRTFWDYARRCMIDPVGGSWHHELDVRNAPAGEIWRGKPDVYHAYQAALLPLLPLAPTVARAVIADLTHAGPI